MFLEYTSDNRDIKLREDFIDFGFAECTRVSESRQITIDNKFPFEVQVNWVLLKLYNQTTNVIVDNPFRITP